METLKGFHYIPFKICDKQANTFLPFKVFIKFLVEKEWKKKYSLVYVLLKILTLVLLLLWF